MTTILEETQWIRKQKACKGTYGIEIETESLLPYDLDRDNRDDTYNFFDEHKLSYWSIVEDHSLRNFGYEYILCKPLVYEKVDKALNEFDEKTKAQHIKFLEDKHSTSVHVHVNMQDETFLTLGNFVTLWTLFEGPLLDFCGDRRKSNFFCMSSSAAEGLCRRLTEFFKNVYEGSASCLIDLSEEAQKYSSINLVPLYKLGSVEIRTMRGVTDVAVISDWVGMLNSLLRFARQDITPLDIIAGWRQGEINFFDSVFGEYTKLLRSNETRGQVERSLWYAGSIAASCPDWNQIVGKLKEGGGKVVKTQPANRIPAGDWAGLQPVDLDAILRRPAENIFDQPVAAIEPDEDF